MDSALHPPTAAAQTAETPLATVDAFYTWYLEYTTPDAEGYFNNPLSDGAYQASPYLSPDLIAAVDALKAEQGGFHADPFLCAQDVPANIFTELIREDAARAEVLVQEQFVLTLHNITAHVVPTDSGWLIDAIFCGETATPGGVVETFYRDYIAVGQYDEAAGSRGNPLLEGAYRSPLLADDLIAEVDALVAAGELHADPLLCAQDMPQWVYGITASEDESSAVAVLLESFQGNPDARPVQVRLARAEDRWQIAAVDCAPAPETIITLVYRHYAEQARLNIDSGMGWDLLQNPMRPWNFFLAEEVLADRLAAREAGGVDPLLCAQDIPAAFEVAAQEDGAYLVSGLFPSGPETFSAYPLAEVRGVETLTGWEITSITCAAR
ncbi:MAG: DUF3828 domain-containing protein [Anaerolineae bacterium]|nr:DUF3828 domain-containing protein [Anaerolineae bacterium]